MFSNLLEILHNEELKQQLETEIRRLLELARESVTEAGEFFWGRPLRPEDRLKLYGKAEAMGDLEQMVRNLLILHLSLATSSDRAHFLGLVNLVREIERLGERAKNLVDLARIGRYPLPSDQLVAGLLSAREVTEGMLRDLPAVLQGSDVRTAQRMSELGREQIRRLESTIVAIAESQYDACHAVTLAAGARVYARIQRQLLNLLSSVVIPLHLIDFFEERAPDGSPPSSARHW